ncbi:adenine-specific DNA-methyltransferase [Staphylococcus epidermidis]|nr:adenine-specific DNA-methyltransferase [Staphylococcus epidermidis]MCG1954901.1 adenine-specific DNA-methyltransferase [Staphylococcus epidermidis]
MNFKDLINLDSFNKDISASNQNNFIINGDSLNELKKIKDDTVDLIFADPPYNIGKNFETNFDKWDNIDSYIDWCKCWIDQCMRVLKKNGTFYFMTATQHMPYLDVYVSEKYHVISRIIWTYDSSGVQSKKKFGSLYEPILMITHNKKSKITFNASDIMVEAPTGSKRKLIDYRKNPPQPYSNTKVPGNVWNFARVRYRMEEYENHPTQKPKKLLERIIKASSNEEDIVLDPFSGSFTTGEVCNELKRNFIGIELNNNYFQIGIRRCSIDSSFNGKVLTKDKARKTKNKSKKDHEDFQQASLFD